MNFKFRSLYALLFLLSFVINHKLFSKGDLTRQKPIEVEVFFKGKYVKEFGSPDQDVKDMFPKELRTEIAKTLADEEYAKIQAGEYDVVKGTIS